MSKSILSNPTPKANFSHHGFNTSQVTKYSTTTGEIIPIYLDFLNPNEKVSLTFNIETLMQPIKNPSFVQLETCIDVFKVPMRLLYKPFEQQFNAISDFNSNFYPNDKLRSNDNSSLPTFNSSLFPAIFNERTQVWSEFYNTSKGERMNARLIDALDFPLSTMYDVSQGGPEGSFVADSRPLSLWFAAAYQKIFFDFYRLTDYTENDPECYNLDRFIFSDNRTWLSQATNVAKFFTMRYVPYRKDYFSNVFASPYINLPTLTSSNHNYYSESLLPAVDIKPSIVGAYTGSGETQSFDKPSIYSNSEFGTALGSEDLSVGDNINVNTLRAMFAQQKLAEVTRRAGKHVDAQTLAHFGIKGSPDMYEHVDFIGHWSSAVEMKQVVSSAETSEASLGSLAGRGQGMGQSGVFKVSSGADHCILMAVQYTRPILDYAHVGLSPLNRLTSLDKFPRTEYDKLGMQPIFGEEAYYHFNVSAQAGDYSETNNQIICWQYRYSPFKLKVNKVRGAFLGSLRDWTISKIPYAFAAQDEGTEAKATFADNFYCRPTDLDSIMAVAFSTASSEAHPTYAGLYASDPLIHQLYVDAKKSSLLSVFGLADNF